MAGPSEGRAGPHGSQEMHPMQESHPSRRGFVRQSAAALAAAAAATQLEGARTPSPGAARRSAWA
jgi:hypothetical protein